MLWLSIDFSESQYKSFLENDADEKDGQSDSSFN